MAAASMDPLSPRQIEAFHQLMLRGSVTATADALGISQPAASRLVAGLERSIGLQLFQRSGNALHPTAVLTPTEI